MFQDSAPIPKAYTACDDSTAPPLPQDESEVRSGSMRTRGDRDRAAGEEGVGAVAAAAQHGEDAAQVLKYVNDIGGIPELVRVLNLISMEQRSKLRSKRGARDPDTPSKPARHRADGGPGRCAADERRRRTDGTAVRPLCEEAAAARRRELRPRRSAPEPGDAVGKTGLRARRTGGEADHGANGTTPYQSCCDLGPYMWPHAGVRARESKRSGCPQVESTGHRQYVHTYIHTANSDSACLYPGRGASYIVASAACVVLNHNLHACSLCSAHAVLMRQTLSVRRCCPTVAAHALFRALCTLRKVGPTSTASAGRKV